MNKTVTINISGIIFHIEEDAYEKLSKYLSTIKSYFSSTDGGNEIMSDIEARIAEMLQGKTSAVKQVVLMADVDFVIDNMGRPEDFLGEQDYESNQNNQNRESRSSDIYDEPVKRRLYRDPDSKVLGGVCGGIGSYFDFDPTWLRIVLALLAFFSVGSLVIVYIILWIAIPEARSTAEKLAMRGEKADINNISKTVQEEAEQARKRMEKYGSDVVDMAKGRAYPKTGADRFLAALGDVLRVVGRVFIVCFSIFLIGVCMIFLFGIITGGFGISMVSSNHEAREWVDMVLLDGSDFYLGFIGALLLVLIPVLLLMYVAVKLLFKIRYSNRWLNMTVGLVWLAALLVCIYVGVRTGKDFSQNGRVRETVAVKTYDTLQLVMNPQGLNLNDYDLHSFDNNEDHGMRYHNDGYVFGEKGSTKYLFGHAELNVIRSQTDKVELVLVKTAQGFTKREAQDRARQIDYQVIQKDSMILFDNVFKIANIDKFRGQDLKVVLKLPVGKVIRLDKSLEHLIYDIENVHNTYDKDMLNRRWIMTDNGLNCLDCQGLDLSNDRDEVKDIRIDSKGIRINGKEAKLHIDSTGVNIKGDHTHIEIDDDGIHVDNN